MEAGTPMRRSISRASVSGEDCVGTSAGIAYALATITVLTFVNSWNQYLLPLLVFTSPQHDTLPLAVANYATQFSQNTAGVLAFTALSMLPALGCFVFLQRYLVAGWAGAVKG